jgi:hypothetical protein
MTMPDRIQITYRPRTMTTPDFRSLCAELLQAWQFGVDIAGPMNRARAALKAEPEGEGPSAADLLPVNPPNIPTTMAMQYRSAWRKGVEDGWSEARDVLARWGPPSAAAPAPGENLATPPSPEAPGEALAARPLLEKLARLENSVGTIFAEVRQLAGQAAAWLRSNPPGQPVAIEPRGCPTPGACSCVEPTPPAPVPGEVAELVALLKIAGRWATSTGVHLDRFAALFDQQAAELATLRGEPVPASERLRVVKAGIRAGYILGHHHTVEGGWGDPGEVADDIAQETLDDLPAPQAGEVEA